MTTPMQDDDPLAKAAERIYMQAETAYFVIRSNGDLTADAQQRQLAKVWTQASDELQALATSAGSDVDTRRAQLLQRLFGTAGLSGDPASLAMSARDASERVAQFAPQDVYGALELLQRAQLTGDEVLARALAARAFSEPFGSWGRVLDAFVSTRPAAAAALGELAQLDQQSRVMGSFVYSGNFYLAKPSELAGLDDWRIRSLASQATS